MAGEVYLAVEEEVVEIREVAEQGLPGPPGSEASVEQLLLALDEKIDIGHLYPAPSLPRGTFAVDLVCIADPPAGDVYAQGVVGPHALDMASINQVTLGEGEFVDLVAGEFAVEFLFVPKDREEGMIYACAAGDGYGFHLNYNRFGARNLDLAKAGLADQIVGWDPDIDVAYHIVINQHFAAGAPYYLDYIVNGVSIGIFEDPTPYNSAIGQVPQFGKFIGGPVNPTCNSIIDEFAIYTRCLDQQTIDDHIAALATNYREVVLATPGLHAYYPFDDDLLDYAGTNHGTVYAYRSNVGKTYPASLIVVKE